MNKEMEQFINNALRMGRELVHAGAKSTAREGATDESTFAMDAGSALLRLVYMVAKLDATVIEQAEMNVEQAQEIADQAQEISRLNTRLRDMAEESNKVAAYKSERDEYREKYELMNAVNDSLESILDDTERQRDALKVERDNARRELDNARGELGGIRRAVNANPEESTLDEVRRVVYERDLARAKLERTSNDINVLIEKYS